MHKPESFLENEMHKNSLELRDTNGLISPSQKTRSTNSDRKLDPV